MRYLILIYGNPASRKIWESFTPAEQRAGLDVYTALNEDLATTGEMVVSQRLADVAHTKRVSVREGQTLVSDGPFAEAKEHLAGFYLVDCVDQARAAEIAGRIPESAFGLVEVRPVLDLRGLEM